VLQDVLDDNKLVVDLENTESENIAHKLCEFGLAVLDESGFDMESGTHVGPRSSSPLPGTVSTAKEAVEELMNVSMSVDYITLYGIPKRTVSVHSRYVFYRT
jgi:hypothetical protein